MQFIYNLMVLTAGTTPN